MDRDDAGAFQVLAQQHHEGCRRIEAAAQFALAHQMGAGKARIERGKELPVLVVTAHQQRQRPGIGLEDLVDPSAEQQMAALLGHRAGRQRIVMHGF